MSQENTKTTILIVDDTPTNIDVIDDILSPNYIVQVAVDGKIALKIIEEQRPDLILLDIMMPEMDGFEVCRHLKADPDTKDIPIIFITAKDDLDSIVSAFELGAADYIAKPFNPKELSARVKTHLELYRSQCQLKKANASLREANATKDKFFSIIAHDLKNPLHSMIGFSDLMENQFDKITDEKKKRYLQNISLASKHLFKLLVNLLEWARLQTGRIEFDPAQFNLNTLIEDALNQLKVQADQKEIQLSSMMEVSTMVFADYNMVDAVVRNLLSNAIKFTPNGGQILVSKIENKDHWEIAVKDSGVGIDLEDQEKLFDLSSKHSTFGTNNEMGTGLGLGLCKEFVERCGGQIWVSSEKNEGSIFRFTLSRRATCAIVDSRIKIGSDQANSCKPLLIN